MELQYEELIAMAYDAQKMAYAPYSRFTVGAALLCQDGTIYTGCNIENAAFTPTNCAERTAFFKAISEGKREFLAIAIVGSHMDEGEEETFCMPCGVCLQVMAEFCKPDSFLIITTDGDQEYRTYLLRELLPHGFTL